ncbi:MAG: prepilin-type N-terminal cleavage/methylation domain-containing protein [Myxococcota bacterium]|jgi:prepilin-type N-terminal cleavage/methylation domain-containing protein|nr:hypothetical protein [Myxococcales bacterium]MBF94849.1 hypothetical protein [Myxococcales bacterium]MEC7751676.1 prepilin-type N-terminal cleavage/methylation domain-containing protein [Myxococcota bacterium]HBU49037.1 hypothetical protein [Myxococcales bacterium]|tara:strand:+ start:1592 stop:2098 length:507 start_codon:yes stop_codon:yes gene_type:complete
MTHTRRGFTLVEVLMSSMIFALAMSGMAPLILMGLKAGRQAHDLNKSSEVMNLVADRVTTGRANELIYPGPGNRPANVMAAPDAGRSCYWLSSDDPRVPPAPDGCIEVGDNPLISREDVSHRYMVAWTLQRETVLGPGSALDRVEVQVGWRSSDRRVHSIETTFRVQR